jgi:hypothetical protein
MENCKLISDELVHILYKEVEYSGKVKIISNLDKANYNIIFYNNNGESLCGFKDVHNENKLKYTSFASKKDEGAMCVTFDNKITVKFDRNSKAAHKAFVKILQEINERKFANIYYPETHDILYHGTMKNGKYDGYGMEFYQNGNVKYQGEFENGLYDGSGEWMSISNKIRVICNSICNGLPTGIGTIEYNGVKKNINFNAFKMLNPKHNNFVYYIADRVFDFDFSNDDFFSNVYNENYDSNIDQNIVIMGLLKEVYKLRKEVNTLKEKNNSGFLGSFMSK